MLKLGGCWKTFLVESFAVLFHFLWGGTLQCVCGQQGRIFRQNFYNLFKFCARLDMSIEHAVEFFHNQPKLEIEQNPKG